VVLGLVIKLQVPINLIFGREWNEFASYVVLIDSQSDCVPSYVQNLARKPQASFAGCQSFKSAKA